MAFTLKYKNTPSPLQCWKGYERVPGTQKGAKGSCRKSPLKKQKGGGTTKTCLPASKIRGLSSEKRKELVSAKKSAGASGCLLYTSPSPRDGLLSRMPSSA